MRSFQVDVKAFNRNNTDAFFYEFYAKTNISLDTPDAYMPLMDAMILYGMALMETIEQYGQSFFHDGAKVFSNMRDKQFTSKRIFG
jgi:hypothetical protein